MTENNPAQPIPEAEDIGPFRITSPVEISFVLRSLTQRASFLTVYFNNGRDLMLTHILDADAKTKRFLFDLGGSELSNQALLKADKALFVANPEGVKIQFSTAQVRTGVFEGKPCFVAPLPADLIKLQRREYFRLPTPIASPYTCRVQWPDGPELLIDLHDVSLGGAGLWFPAEYRHLLVPGIRIERAGFDFGRAGHMTIDFEVRNWHSITNRNNQTQYILGVRFINISRNQEASLQRLISQLERERKALLG
jgi:flagellar brake protein